MAIYRLNVKTHSRGEKGRSALSIASYRSEEKLKDERINKTFDYSKKSLCLHSEIFLPEGADEQLKDRGFLWNQVEKSEVRKNSRLCREVVVALPKELNLESHKKIVRDFCQENFVSKGMACDVAVHNEKGGNGNFHAHILLTTREIEGKKFTKKKREWDKKELLLGWRESWQNVVNEKLKVSNKIARIDHRKLEDRGTKIPFVLATNNNKSYQLLKYYDLRRINQGNRKRRSEDESNVESYRINHRKRTREELPSVIGESIRQIRERLKNAVYRALRSYRERQAKAEREKKIHYQNLVGNTPRRRGPRL